LSARRSLCSNITGPDAAHAFLIDLKSGPRFARIYMPLFSVVKLLNFFTLVEVDVGKFFLT